MKPHRYMVSHHKNKGLWTVLEEKNCVIVLCQLYFPCKTTCIFLKLIDQLLQVIILTIKICHDIIFDRIRVLGMLSGDRS